MAGDWDACPGNTNAIFPISTSTLPLSGHAGGRELLFNLFVDTCFRQAGSDADAVLNSVCVRTPVRYHAHAAHAQQDPPARFPLIDLLLQAFPPPPPPPTTH